MGMGIVMEMGKGKRVVGSIPAPRTSFDLQWDQEVEYLYIES